MISLLKYVLLPNFFTNIFKFLQRYFIFLKNPDYIKMLQLS